MAKPVGMCRSRDNRREGFQKEEHKPRIKAQENNAACHPLCTLESGALTA